MPYWVLYLQAFDFDAQTIGSLMALLHFSRIFAPNLWGWLADRSGKRVTIVRLGALMTWLLFIGIFWQDSAWGIGLVMLAFSFFSNAVLPQFEVITLNELGEQRHKYSLIRLWGSIGFIVTVVGIGALLDWLPIQALPWIMLGLMLLIWLNTLCIAKPDAEAAATVVQGDKSTFMALLLRPQVLAFFAICFLVQLGHGAYYTFYSVLMIDVGLSRTAVGLLWAVGVIAEVILFIYMHRLLQRFSMRSIMLVSLMLCVVRWLLIAWVPDSLAWMLFAQLLHAATFGALHSVGIALVNDYFTTTTYGQGQALFSSFGFGLGGAIGAFSSGLIWAKFGAQVTFSLAAVVAAIAIVLAWVWIHPEKLQQND